MPFGELKSSVPSPDEAQEIQVREIIADTLPLILEKILQKEKDSLQRTKEGDLQEEDISDYKQARVDFLETLNPSEAEQRVYEEWQRGDDTLVISFLTIQAVQERRAMRYIEEEEKRSKTTVPGAPTLEDLRNLTVKTNQTLNWLIGRSQTFGKTYSAQDLLEWVRRKEEGMREMAGVLTKAAEPGSRLSKLSPRAVEEYAVLDRILSGNAQPEDREELAKILDEDAEGALDMASIFLVDVLRGDSASGQGFTKCTAELLELYQIRSFVDEIIPPAQQ